VIGILSFFAFHVTSTLFFGAFLLSSSKMRVMGNDNKKGGIKKFIHPPNCAPLPPPLLTLFPIRRKKKKKKKKKNKTKLRFFLSRNLRWGSTHPCG